MTAQIREEDRQVALKITLPRWCFDEDCDHLSHKPNEIDVEATASLIAQLRADAFTEGEAVGIERGAELSEKWAHQLTGAGCHITAAGAVSLTNKIRALSPDPDYIERVKAGVWGQAARIADRVAAESGTDGNAGPVFPDNQAINDTAVRIAAALRSHTTKQ